MRRILILTALLLVVATPTSEVCAQGGCGLKPLKPLVPLGCRDLVLQCTCNVRGEQCRWTWICVPRR